MGLTTGLMLGASAATGGLFVRRRGKKGGTLMDMARTMLGQQNPGTPADELPPAVTPPTNPESGRGVSDFARETLRRRGRTRGGGARTVLGGATGVSAGGGVRRTMLGGY